MVTAVNHRPRQTTDHDVRVGRRIRVLRQEKGMSQTELGSYCGVTFQQVQKYEEGRNRISGGRLLTICKVLGVDVSYLLDGADRPARPAQTVIENLLSEHWGYKLASAFLQIEEAKVKSDIVVFVEQLARVLKRKHGVK